MAALGAALFLQPPTARAQDLEFNDVYGLLGASSGELVFTPVVPCRIIDTRVAGGRMTPGVPRDFDVAGALTGQGGAPNCGVPEGPAVAVALNFVAVAPGGIGNMRAWPFGTVAPTASLINFSPGVTIANAVVIGICDPSVGSCPKDFVARADASDIDLVADVMGYFSSPSAGPGTVPWSAVTGKPAGFADDVDNDTEYTGSSGVVLTGTNFTADTTFMQRRVTPICAAGSSIRVINADGTVACEPDDNTVTGVGVSSGLTLTAGVLGTETNTILQRRVGGTCSAGQSIRTIDAAGNVTCEVDTDTTYTGSLGVTLTGTNFTADTAFLQRRVTGTCPANFSIRAIDAAGAVTCEQDNDTVVLPGFGITPSGSTWNVEQTEFQRRVTAVCPSGIVSMNEAGVASCAPRILAGRETPTLCNTETPVVFNPPFSTTPSVTLTAQGLAGTTAPPQTYCVVNALTSDGFWFCCWGHLTEQVNWIAMSTTQ
jgi:hypothetical protein